MGIEPDMHDLFLIPARGGSKGIPGKNIKPLHGRPLIYYTLDAACEVAVKENICVSTDARVIAEKVEGYGLSVPFLRPAELATDTAGSRDVILHALAFYEQKGLRFDRLILLQPTSPFRTGRHIQEALCLYQNDLDMVVSVTESKANPYFTLFEENRNRFLFPSKPATFRRRQDCPAVYEYNGAIYVINVESVKAMPMNQFKKIRKCVMTEEASIDIDTPMDWLLAEAVMAQRTSPGTKEAQI